MKERKMDKTTTPKRVERGGVAQLGERLPCKQEASGSNPLISTKSERTARLLKRGRSCGQVDNDMARSKDFPSNRNVKKGLIAQLVRARA